MKQQLSGTKRKPLARNWVPMMYVTFYGIMRDIAQKHGWALAVHGSCVRDFDVVLIPWVEEPKSVLMVLAEWAKWIGSVVEDGKPYDTMTKKAHGRVAYTLQVGGGGYLDISVMPVKRKRGAV